MWAVIDPTTRSKLGQFVWRTTPDKAAKLLKDPAFKKRHGAIHSGKAEAIQDADNRMHDLLSPSDRNFEKIRAMFSSANIARELKG